MFIAKAHRFNALEGETIELAVIISHRRPIGSMSKSTTLKKESTIKFELWDM
jgi:hypothetical protein